MLQLICHICISYILVYFHLFVINGLLHLGVVIQHINKFVADRPIYHRIRLHPPEVILTPPTIPQYHQILETMLSIQYVSNMTLVLRYPIIGDVTLALSYIISHSSYEGMSARSDPCANNQYELSNTTLEYEYKPALTAERRSCGSI